MNQAPIKFRFLQFSDVLLDSKLTHTGTSPGGLITGNPALPKHERQERAREILEATINAFSLAQSEKVDAILIPGGLWDNVTVTGYTVNTVIEAASAIQDIPIFIAPGHRDFYTRSSLYSNDMLQARGLKSWPANVHIFSHEHFTCVPHPHREEIAFIGRACSKNSRRTERILSGHLPRNPKAALHIALFAGTLETHPSHLASQSNQQSAKRSPIYPFSEQELADEALTYAAVGHLREAYQIILPHENDRLIGAYSGCLAGGTFEELGTRFAIIGEINLDSEGKTSIELTPQELDNRRMMLVTVDVSGLGEEDIAAEVIIAMEESEVRPDSDVVCVNLEGRHKPSVDAKSVVENLAADFYYLQVCDNTRPDYLADRMDERTTEWKYIASMLDMKAKVERNKNVPLGTDSLSGIPGMDLSGKTIEDALYYGLDALKQKKVTIKNVG
jgi:DNA repair exonuclease SbcCD nuclease subunit